MHKTWLIIKREYITRVKTKGFVIGTVVVPLLGIGFVFLIVFLVGHQSRESVRLAIVDNAGNLADSVARGLDQKLPDGRPMFTITQSFARPAAPDAVQDVLRGKVNSGALDAYLVLPKDLSQPVEFHTKNPGSFSLLGPLNATLNRAIIEARLNARGFHAGDVQELVKNVDLQTIKVTKSGESVERGQTLGLAIALVVLLYMSLLMYGIITMRSVLEEKTTRTMEVLISAVRPFELLAGKIIGVAGVAFTQFGIWAASLAVLGAYGVTMAAMNGGNSWMSGLHVPLPLLIYVAVFFFGGYFLFASMFAAIGSACSNEQDAQQLQWLAMAPLVFTMLIYSVILNDASSRVAVILTEIPFFAPVLMPLRISLQMPPAWQIALSICLLYLTAVAVIYGSAKIYRVGILMYGKRPTVPELVRWMRYS